MKFAFILGAAAILCIAFFRFARFCKRTESSLKQYTLWEIYADFLHEMGQMAKLRMKFFIPLGLMGLYACFFPIMLLVAVRLAGPTIAGDVRILLFLAGLLAVAGAAVNVLMMLLSQISFGFGTSQRKNETIFFWIIAVFQFAFALLAIASAVSHSVAGLLYRLIV